MKDDIIKLEFIYCLIEQDYELDENKYGHVLKSILSQTKCKTILKS